MENWGLEEADKLIYAIDEVMGYSSATVISYRKILKDFVSFMGGIDEAVSASADDADRWLQDLVDRGMAPASCQHFDWGLSSIFGRLFELEMIPSNPLASKRGPKPYPKPQLYHNPVSAPEMRAIVEHAECLFLNPCSTKKQAMKGLMAYLHVRYCIPFNALLGLRVCDYVPSGMFGALTWFNGKKREYFTVSLDKQAALGMDRHLQSLGETPPDYPLFPRLEGARKGMPYSRTAFNRITMLIIEEAGVELGGRSLKAGAVELALDTGMSGAEVITCLPAISNGMLMAALERRGVREEGELLDRLDMETRSRVPVAQGSVETTVLSRALEEAGNRDRIGFVVTATGKLEFTTSET